MSRGSEPGEGVADARPDPPSVPSLTVPSLTVAAVARRLGVAPPTLRTWDRRYDLGPSDHIAGAHRRYSPSDVARLMVMRRLTLQGVAPADAARIARDVDVLAADPAAVEAQVEATSSWPAARSQEIALEAADTLDQFSDLDLGLAQDGNRAAAGAAQGDAQVVRLPWRDDGEQTAWLGVLRRAEGRGPAGGGRVVAMPDGTQRSRGLARAAMTLDTQEMHRLLLAATRAEGVVDTWNELIMPVLRALGERTVATGDGIDVEHAFTEVVLSVFRGAVALVQQPRNLAPVLLACADQDYHSLPLHALAAGLAERQVSTRMLGTGLPPAALAASVRRTGPAVIVLFARMAGADAAASDQLRRQRPSPAVVLAGPGWDPTTIPSFARRANSLAEAIEQTLAAAQT